MITQFFQPCILCFFNSARRHRGVVRVVAAPPEPAQPRGIHSVQSHVDKVRVQYIGLSVNCSIFSHVSHVAHKAKFEKNDNIYWQLGDASPPPHVRAPCRGQPRVAPPLLDPRLRAAGERGSACELQEWHIIMELLQNWMIHDYIQDIFFWFLIVFAALFQPLPGLRRRGVGSGLHMERAARPPLRARALLRRQHPPIRLSRPQTRQVREF